MGRSGIETITVTATITLETLSGNRTHNFKIEIQSTHDRRADATAALAELGRALEQLPRAANGTEH
jgi:hypothetical protein